MNIEPATEVVLKGNLIIKSQLLFVSTLFQSNCFKIASTGKAT